VFKISSTGNFTTLHEFDGAEGGKNPQAGLIQASDGYFYGTTVNGGGSGAGTVFKISSSGSFSVVHEFNGVEGGANPQAGLIQASDGNFYGTTSGAVFKIDSSRNFSVLRSFSTGGGVIIQGSDGNLYGTTGKEGGGSYDWIFYKLDLNGNFTQLSEIDTSWTNPSSLIQASDGNFYVTTSESIFSDFIATIFKIDSSGTITQLASLGEESYDGLIQASDGNFYITGYNAYGGPNPDGKVYKMDASGNFTVLHEFDGKAGEGYPYAALVQGLDGRLYGTTVNGGSDGSGTVFTLDLSGNFQVLGEFKGTPVSSNTDLIQTNDDNFYGTTSSGGSYDYGAVFEWTPSGDLTILHSFDGYTEGAFPKSVLKGNDGSLYGITDSGWLDWYFSDYISPTLFKIDPDGNFSSLYAFSTSSTGEVNGKLVQTSDGSIYGTLTYGLNGYGTLFKLDPASGNVTIVHEFDGAAGGANPQSEVIQGTDGNLYGIASGGGTSGIGIVYKLDLSGNFSVLHDFNGTGEGAYPNALIQDSGGHLYGTTSAGGPYGAGIMYQLDLSGNFSVLHEFDTSEVGGGLTSFLRDSSGNFYGATLDNGNDYNGLLFKIDPLGNFTVIHEFDGTDGRSPAKVILANEGGLYGITAYGGLYGGSYDGGVIFRLVGNAAPMAQAGPDQTVNAGSLVTLNGSGSSDPDHEPSPLTYQWTQTGGPSVALKGPTTAQPSFTPLEPGTYVLNLVVNDGEDSSAADSVTVTVNDADYVLIQSPNGGEVWNEKSKQTITWISRNLDSKLRLVLYLSTDNGQTWSKIASPKNSGSKSWKVPKNRYVSKQALFKLCVKQDDSLCDVSDAVFTINKAPKAEAGKKQKVTVGTEVHLDGSASVDADHGPSPLTYRWTQISGPAATLSGADTANPSFVPTVKGSYRFSLVVNDGAIDSKADKVAVRVQKAP
jgi:uncharacterized repeat protein (TIGR03803 family)